MVWKHLPFVLFAASAASVVAWAGCGDGSSGRYYCDDTSCYQCDGYGCTTVSAPPGASCTGTAGCATNETCTTTGCVANCAVDSDCPKGDVCHGGLCLAPSAAPPVTKDCTTNADCGSGKSCAAGKCEACGGTAGPCPCTQASDCASTDACVAGACTAQTNTCQFSSQCGDGKVCANGQCLVQCAAGGSTCGGSTQCIKGVCEPQTGNVDGGADGGGALTCVNDSSCTDSSAPNCVSGVCVASCTTDATCGAGNYCNQGACVVDTRPQPNCTDDTQCNAGDGGSPQKCMAGYCKYTCTTDLTCEHIDSRIGYCAADGVCRNQAEAHPQCTQQSDCSATQDCIGNVCE